MLPRIVVLGEKPQAALWLHSLIDSGLFTIVAGVPGFRERRWWGNDEFVSMLQEHSIPVLHRKDIKDYDILISFLYPFIIEKKYIDQAKWYCLNLHESPLPRYPGCNGSSHAILDGDDTYGTTLHILSPDLDAGDIVDQKCFPVLPEETSKELYMRTSEVSLSILARNINAIAQKKITTRHNAIEVDPHARSSLEKLKNIPFGEWENISRIVRALDFPPFEPAYSIVNGKKIYFFIDGSNGRMHHDVEIGSLTDLGKKAVFAIPLVARSMIAMEESLYRTLYPVFSTT